MIYDTTFEHETFNPSDDEERVVLHIGLYDCVCVCMYVCMYVCIYLSIYR